MSLTVHPHPPLRPSSLLQDVPGLVALITPLLTYLTIRIHDPAAFFISLLTTFLQPRTQTTTFHWTLDCSYRHATPTKLVERQKLEEEGGLKEVEALVDFVSSYDVDCLLRQFWFYFTLDLAFQLFAFALCIYAILRLIKDYYLILPALCGVCASLSLNFFHFYHLARPIPNKVDLGRGTLTSIHYNHRDFLHLGLLFLFLTLHLFLWLAHGIL